MSNPLVRRLANLEKKYPSGPLPYAILPEPSKSMEEWLGRLEALQNGTGRYELEPYNPRSYIRLKKWVWGLPRVDR